MISNKQDKKLLHIEVADELLTNLVGEYCKEAGVDEQEIGFLIGHITGRAGDDSLPNLVKLTRVFFNAGVYLGSMKGKKKFTMRYLTNKEIISRSEKIRQKANAMLFPNLNNKGEANYVG